MSEHTILRAAEAPDYSGDDSPGAFYGYAGPMGSEVLGVNIRVYEPGQANVPPGMDENAGHSHKDDIEEIYVVLEGEVTFKVADEIFTLGPRDAVRVPPETPRASRNEGDVDAVMLMVSPKMSDPRGQSEFHEDFWT